MFYKQKTTNADYSVGVMETGDHSKNGASLKSHTSRGNIFVLSLIVSIFLLNSCQVVSLTGRQATLSEKSSYTSVIYQCSWPVAKQSPVELHYSFGVGSVKFDNIDSFENFNVGAGLDYFFSRKRFQPYLGIDVNNIGYTDESKEEKFKKEYNYVNVTPNLGTRFFLSNRFAINASLGYQFGWGKSKFNNVTGAKNTFSGIAPSIGISYVIMLKDIN